MKKKNAIMNLYIIEISFKLRGQILSQLLKNYPSVNFILYVNLSKDKTYIGYFSGKQIDFNINIKKYKNKKPKSVILHSILVDKLPNRVTNLQLKSFYWSESKNYIGFISVYLDKFEISVNEKTRDIEKSESLMRKTSELMYNYINLE